MKFKDIVSRGEGESSEKIREPVTGTRTYDRILKVARTAADPAGEDALIPVHIYEAIQYRMMDRYY